MKKKRKSIIFITGIIYIYIFVIIFNFDSNVNSSVDSSIFCTAEALHWGDKSYSIVPEHCYYEEGGLIVTTSDGANVNAVVSDPSQTFVVVRSFLDNGLYVRDDYKIPTSGNLSLVSWNRKNIEDKEFLKAIQDILKNRKTDFKYDTEAIFMLSDKQRMKPLYFAYNNCPVATNYIGYMGIVSGKWVITTNISKDLRHVSVSIIPDEAAKIFTPYFKNKFKKS